MEESGEKEHLNKNVTKLNTFPVPFALRELKESNVINTHKSSQPSKEQIMDEAFNFHLKGNISESIKYYKYIIKQDFSDHRVFSNYGSILRDLGNLQEAEIYTRKAIELNPLFAEAHSNLGIILKDLGKLDESICSYTKAIELNKDLTDEIAEIGKIMTLKGNYKEGLKKIREGNGTIIFDHITSEMKISS